MSRHEKRVAARGLLLTEDRRTLLLQTQLRWLGAVWMVPGGGVESGESLIEAAAREVLEETGLVVADVGPEIWRRQVTIRLRERTIDLDEHYFLVEVPEFEPSFEGFEDYEIEEHLGYRWWSAEAILESPDTFAPPEIGHLIGELHRAVPSGALQLASRIHTE